MLRDSADLVRRLLKDGFVLISIKGSHHKYHHAGLRRTVIVPHPKKDLPAGTVRAIYRQAGWEKD